jgi:hypothetical protein
MKKLHYFLTLFLLCSFAIFSCQKDKAEIKDESIKNDATKITKQLQVFKLNLQSKSGETMAADSAEWYLEGLLNLELANNTHEFGDVDFFHDTIAVPISDRQISLDELNKLYMSIDAWAEILQQQSGNEDYTFDIVDLNLETTGLKSGTQNLVVSLSGGVLGTGLNYIPFGPTDYWYWGSWMGKCGEFWENIHADAATELQRKFRNPIALPGAGYYTSIDIIDVIPGFDSEFYDPNNAPYDGYMLYRESVEYINFDRCLSPSDLNYFLSKFDFIKNTKQPSGKQYKTVYANYLLIYNLGEWIQTHKYSLYYGIKIEFED